MKTIIYARQSKDRNGDGAAVDRQLAECRELAEANGWHVAAEIVDNDKSATKGERPGWKRLLIELDQGKYDALVCWHTDRLYRRLRDLVDLMDVVEKRGLKIAAVKAGDLDLSTPTGRMVAGLLGNVADYEVQHKGERQRAANRQRASAGHVGWSLRPYGYDRHINDPDKHAQPCNCPVKDGSIFIVESEAAILRECAKRVLDGEPTRSIVKDLNARAVPTMTGKPWTTTPLRRMLTSPRNAGRAVLNGEHFGKGDWPAIFDAETHDRLVAVFSDPNRRRTASPTVKNLLSGILVCGRCGESLRSPMYAMPERKGHTQRRYACKVSAHLSRRQDWVDEYITTVVIERLSQPDALDLLVPDVDLDALRAEATELRKRRDAIADMLAEGLVSADAAKDKARDLTRRIADVEARIGSAEGSSPAVAVASSADPSATWQALDLVSKREIITTLMDITVLPTKVGNRPFDPADIKITWRSYPTL